MEQFKMPVYVTSDTYFKLSQSHVVASGPMIYGCRDGVKNFPCTAKAGLVTNLIKKIVRVPLEGGACVYAVSPRKNTSINFREIRRWN